MKSKHANSPDGSSFYSHFIAMFIIHTHARAQCTAKATRINALEISIKMIYLCKPYDIFHEYENVHVHLCVCGLLILL